MKQREFKEKMPECAAFIESLVKEFGQELIHGQIRKGLAGQPTFWARENGHEIGARDTVATSAIYYDEHGLSHAVDTHWMIDARAEAERRGIQIPKADRSNQNDVEREAQALRAVLDKANARKK